MVLTDFKGATVALATLLMKHVFGVNTAKLNL